MMIASFLLLLFSITSSGGFAPVARFVDRSNAVLFASSDSEPPQQNFSWLQKYIGIDDIVSEQKSIVSELRGVQSILRFLVEDRLVSRYDLKRMMVTSAHDVVAFFIQRPELTPDFSIIDKLLSNEALASFVNHVVGGDKNSGFLTFPQGKTTASKSQLVAIQSVLKEIYSVYDDELQYRLEKNDEETKIETGDDAPSVNDIPNQSSSGSIVQEVTSYHLVAGHKILAELTNIFDQSGIPTLDAALSPDVTVPPFYMDTSLVAGALQAQNAFGARVGSVTTYVFNPDSGMYEFVQILFGAPGAFGGFGNSIALSDNGSILAVGNNDGVDFGEVTVFRLQSGSWIQLGQTLNGDDNADSFGDAVALNAAGDILAASSDDDLGFVRVFRLIDNTWRQLGQLLVGPNDRSEFGTELSLSATGFVLAVGVENNDEARVFRYA